KNLPGSHPSTSLENESAKASTLLPSTELEAHTEREHHLVVIDAVLAHQRGPRVGLVGHAEEHTPIIALNVQCHGGGHADIDAAASLDGEVRRGVGKEINLPERTGRSTHDVDERPRASDWHIEPRAANAADRLDGDLALREHRRAEPGLWAIERKGLE